MVGLRTWSKVPKVSKVSKVVISIYMNPYCTSLGLRH